MHIALADEWMAVQAESALRGRTTLLQPDMHTMARLQAEMGDFRLVVIRDTEHLDTDPPGHRSQASFRAAGGKRVHEGDDSADNPPHN